MEQLDETYWKMLGMAPGIMNGPYKTFSGIGVCQTPLNNPPNGANVGGGATW